MNKTIDMTENEYRLLLAVESGESASQRKLSEIALKNLEYRDINAWNINLPEVQKK